MTDRARYWQDLVRDQERSGLTQKAFCRQRQVNPGTFAWWRRKLLADGEAEPARGARRGRSVSRSEPHQFVEVLGSSPRRYEIELAGGRVLRVPADFDPENVKRLIQAVEAAC